MISFEESQVGSVFIGKKVYTNAKTAEALKMFENVVPVQTTTSPTLVLPNTNSGSIAVNRGA